MSELIVAGLALAALVLSLAARGRIRALEDRLAALERRLPGASESEAGGDAGTEEPENPAGESPQAAAAEDIPADTEPPRAAAARREDRPASPWSGGRAAGAAGSGRASTAPRRPRPAAAPLAGLADWLRANWIFPVAGAALVLAAVYLVQYSIDAGLLSPRARIGLALLLGALLIAAGEGVRRRWGADAGSARIVPETLAGAGIFALLATVLAAFHLYGLLSAPAALLALAAIAALALALGWVHGPFLAALGVLAGSAAPFALGGGQEPSDLLHAYFGVIALLGLGIDGHRRWGWVSALAVAAPLLGAAAIERAGAGPEGLIALVLAVAALAMALPFGTLVPAARGPGLWQRCRRAGWGRVVSPLWVPALALALGSAIVLMLGDPILSVAGLLGLALLHAAWTARAPALADQALIPALAVPLAAWLGWLDHADLLRALARWPAAPLAIVALAALVGVVQIRRGEAAKAGARAFWSVLGVATPMGVFISLELFWAPGARLGGVLWPATAMALAAGYVALAAWAARRDAGQGLRLGLAVMAGFTMIALSLLLTLSLAALTAALAVLMVAAALMDRRFDIPLIGWFQVFASMALAYRMIVAPGLVWLLAGADQGGASGVEVAVSVAASLAGPMLALWLTRPDGAGGDERGHQETDALRAWSRAFVETGLTGLVPVAALVLSARAFAEPLSAHAALGLHACVLMAMAWVHAQRAGWPGAGPRLRALRLALAGLFGLVGAAAIAISLTFASPLFAAFVLRREVQGWPVLNDLLIGYAAPALLLLVIAARVPGRWADLARLAGVVLLAHWIGLVIRHAWAGSDDMPLSRGVQQGELYAYTVALLAGGAGALAAALRLGRNDLRVLGLSLIAIAAAKAFLIDASGLAGLLRAGAFLGLGLSLVGLAWLNAWVSARIHAQDDGH